MVDRSAVSRPAPMPEGLNAEFYQHCAQGELCFQRCTDCGTWRHLPRVMCAHCGSDQWSWQRASGRGRLFSWTVTHQAMHPSFAGDVPYIVAVIELDEGVRMVSGVRNLPPDRLQIDLPMEVTFEHVSEDIALPYFRLRAA